MTNQRVFLFPKLFNIVQGPTSKISVLTSFEKLLLYLLLKDKIMESFVSAVMYISCHGLSDDVTKWHLQE